MVLCIGAVSGALEYRSRISQVIRPPATVSRFDHLRPSCARSSTPSSKSISDFTSIRLVLSRRSEHSDVGLSSPVRLINTSPDHQRWRRHDPCLWGGALSTGLQSRFPIRGDRHESLVGAPRR